MIERLCELEDRVGRDGAAQLLAALSSVGLELVRLPVAVSTGLTADRAEACSSARCYVVERVLGHGWTVALPSTAIQTEAAAARTAAGTADAGALLPARLEIDACTALLEALATRGALIVGRGRRSALPELGPARAASYPFWLSYRRDRRGRPRFDALDAVTGSRPGSALRAALAAALIAADAVGRQIVVPDRRS
jgi:hypothetical protein